MGLVRSPAAKIHIRLVIGRIIKRRAGRSRFSGAGQELPTAHRPNRIRPI
jgi:hypothetical protein